VSIKDHDQLIVGLTNSLAVQYAKQMGHKTIAVDIDDKRLESAKALGAVEAFNSLNGLDKLREYTSGGVDVAICLSGSAKAYETAVSILRPGGTLMVVGIVRITIPEIIAVD